MIPRKATGYPASFTARACGRAVIPGRPIITICCDRKIGRERIRPTEARIHGGLAWVGDFDAVRQILGVVEVGLIQCIALRGALLERARLIIAAGADHHGTGQILCAEQEVQFGGHVVIQPGEVRGKWVDNSRTLSTTVEVRQVLAVQRRRGTRDEERAGEVAVVLVGVQQQSLADLLRSRRSTPR